MKPKSNIDINELVDFALGKLTPEKSLRVLEKIESDPEASGMLEVIVQVSEVFANYKVSEK